MRIFVTGGTGFIGRRVVPLLKKHKHKVYLMKARLAELGKAEKELKRFKPDVVLHLAWEGIPDYGAQMAAKNTALHAQFLALLARLGVKKVVAVGSCFEYDSENSGHWAYTVSKCAVRDIGRALFRESGGVFVWAVPFFVYGVGKPAKSLFPNLIAQANGGKTPTVKNDSAHDFVYADDVARALVLLAEKKVQSDTYDIGSGRLTRTTEIAREVARVFKVSLPRVVSKRKAGRVARTHTLKKLGWKPVTTIREGIKAMRYGS